MYLYINIVKKLMQSPTNWAALNTNHVVVEDGLDF